ncbi:hypothetical protein KUTeg_022495 [Tegillarca granosa]|uniref:Uncharacterized protein n=1 Tax=Tegillarca granosa TaxID=220873 RepID=A0ABQ9E988_TEGGR|nr:hypothetical protein KUTeg_022495 [Tegillarca granosa]
MKGKGKNGSNLKQYLSEDLYSAKYCEKKYFNRFKKWNEFAMLENMCSLPAQPLHIALFLTYLKDKNISYSIIESIVYAIKSDHKLKGFLRYDEVSPLTCKDLVFHVDYLFLFISKSKVDQYRQGEQLVRALSHKTKHFSYTRTRETVIARLIEVCGDINIGLHSMRSSGASVVARSAVSERCWKRHGR